MSDTATPEAENKDAEVTPVTPETTTVKPDAPARDADGNERPDLTRCAFKTAKGRRCKLFDGHPDTDKKGGHVFMFRNGVAAPPTLAELRKKNESVFGAFSLVMEEVPDGADLGREYNREPERDEDQKKVDGDAKTAYDAWLELGKPEKFENSGKAVRRYIFPPDAFDTIILMLRRATQSGGPVNGKRLEYRRKTHESGNAMVYFRIVDAKPVTPRTTVTNAAVQAEAQKTTEESTNAAREIAEAIVADAEAKDVEVVAEDAALLADVETSPEIPAESAAPVNDALAALRKPTQRGRQKR